MYNKNRSCLLGLVMTLGLWACSEELQPRDNVNDPQGIQNSNANSAATPATALLLSNGLGDVLLDRANAVEAVLQLYVGKDQVIEATVVPLAAEQGVEFSTDQAELLQIDSVEGKPLLARVRGLQVGKAWLRVRSADGAMQDSLSIEFLQPDAAAQVTSVVLGHGGTSKLGDTLVVYRGASVQLIATVLPAAAVSPLTWTTSSPTSVTVDANGLITARNIGVIKITVSASNGVSDVLYVDVLQQLNGSIWDARTLLKPIVGSGGAWFTYASDAAYLKDAQPVRPMPSADRATQWQKGLDTAKMLVAQVALPAGLTAEATAGLGFSFNAARDVGYFPASGICVNYASDMPVHVVLKSHAISQGDYEVTLGKSIAYTTIDLRFVQFAQPQWALTAGYGQALLAQDVYGVGFLYAGDEFVAVKGTLRIRAVGAVGECIF